MTKKKLAASVNRLSQQYAYTSIQMHEAIARKAGFTGTDHKYLGFLIQKEQMTAGELSVLTGLTTGAVTGLIDRFEKKKLVKRQFDKDDRRKIIIIPDTAKITALLEPFYKDFRDNTHQFFESFSAADLQTLEKYFQGSMEIMKKKTESINQKK